MGVEVQLSVAYEHEQQGTGENTNRVIMDKARSILLESGLEKRFWPDALQTAVYTCNRSPHSGVGGIPIERFTSNRVNIANLRVFGSWCWTRKPSEKLKGKNKLLSRARLGRFIGYANGGHAYKVIVMETGELIISTNVKFDEYAVDNPEKQNAWKPKVSYEDECAFDDDSDDTSSEKNDGEQDTNDKQTDTSTKEDDEDSTSPRESVLRRSSRLVEKQSSNWARQDTRNPIHFAFRANQVLDQEDPAKRKEARDKEIATIRSYNTWELKPLPKGRKAVGSTWVDTIKKDGTLKSRLVVRGFTQVQGVDFFDTFAPVAKPATVRIFLAVCNAQKKGIHQSDVTAAYLNGTMEEDIYMEQPVGYAQKGPNGEKLYCKLIKALYGTKQAGRAWRKVIKEFLTSLGFHTCIFDPCLFVRGSDKEMLLIIVWVDDLLIGYDNTNQSGFDTLWKALSEKFTISDLGQISDYVGMQITRDLDHQTLHLSQHDNIDKMCQHFQMENQDRRVIPIRAGLTLIAKDEGETISNKPYRSLIGCLLYPSQWTRPDISYAVGQLSQFLESPSESHWNTGIDVLRYLKGSRSMAMTYSYNGDMEVTGFADSNFAADLSTGKSVYGYVIYVGGNPISWKSKKSKTTATSTTMAELEALYQAVTEAIWVYGLLKSMDLIKLKYIKMYSDNMGVVNLVHGEKYLDRTKHEVVRVEFLRDKIRDGTLKVEWIATENMVADIFTKGLGKNVFGKHVSELKLELVETNE